MSWLSRIQAGAAQAYTEIKSASSTAKNALTKLANKALSSAENAMELPQVAGKKLSELKPGLSKVSNRLQSFVDSTILKVSSSPNKVGLVQVGSSRGGEKKYAELFNTFQGLLKLPTISNQDRYTGNNNQLYTNAKKIAKAIADDSNIPSAIKKYAFTLGDRSGEVDFVHARRLRAAFLLFLENPDNKENQDKLKKCVELYKNDSLCHRFLKQVVEKKLEAMKDVNETTKELYQTISNLETAPTTDDGMYGNQFNEHGLLYSKDDESKWSEQEINELDQFERASGFWDSEVPDLVKP